MEISGGTKERESNRTVKKTNVLDKLTKTVDEEKICGQRTIRKMEKMMKEIIFEQMGGTYSRHGDYLISYLALLEEQRYIGVWG